MNVSPECPSWPDRGFRFSDDNCQSKIQSAPSFLGCLFIIKSQSNLKRLVQLVRESSKFTFYNLDHIELDFNLKGVAQYRVGSLLRLCRFCTKTFSSIQLSQMLKMNLCQCFSGQCALKTQNKQGEVKILTLSCFILAVFNEGLNSDNYTTAIRKDFFLAKSFDFSKSKKDLLVSNYKFDRYLRSVSNV